MEIHTSNHTINGFIPATISGNLYQKFIPKIRTRNHTWNHTRVLILSLEKKHFLYKNNINTQQIHKNRQKKTKT